MRREFRDRFVIGSDVWCAHFPATTFQVSNIQVSRVRNGQIVALRDHHNHLVLAEVLGQLPTLLAAPANEDLT